MVAAAAVMRLHIDGSFIGLDICAAQQLASHRSRYRHQHLSDGHHPTAHRGPADIDARIAQQSYALAIKRTMVAVLVHHCVDDDFIRHQALVDDPVRKSRCHHAFLGAGFAGPLLALGHLHEIARRLDGQHFAHFVADHGVAKAALAAYALLRSAGNHPFHAGKIGGQSLASGMRTLLPFRSRRRCRAFALGNHLFATDAGLLFKQLQLQTTQLLAARTILFDPPQTKTLFENLDLQPCIFTPKPERAIL